MELRFVLLSLTFFVARAQNLVPPDIAIAGSIRPRFVSITSGVTNNVINGTKFMSNVESVIKFLSVNTPADGYATCLGYGDYPNDAYAHSGCYNNSEEFHCILCITNAYGIIRNTTVSIADQTFDARLWINETIYRCYLRYGNYNFTQEHIISGTLGVLGPNSSIPTSGGSSSYYNIGVIGGATVGGTCLILAIAIGFIIFRRRKAHTFQTGPVVFSYHCLCLATSYFKDENKLGHGGFGAVYKAVLENGSQVAVKKLSMQSKQGKKEFINEINIITNIQHRNLARLRGYGVEGDERLLVYEFLDNGSLDQALFRAQMDWETRFQVVIGVARGLAYLHEESYIQIIHRDIKASNILLDDNLQPKISDFGLSKLFDDRPTSTIAGTIGYLAPEYATYGLLTPKADVFSFGVLVLEIVSGRKCIAMSLPHEEELLVLWTWRLYKSGKLEELVDKRLGSNYEWEQVYRVICVALLCTQDFEEDRPKMSDVITMLLGYVQLGPLPHEAPQYFLSTDASTSTSEGSTTTKPLFTSTPKSVTLPDAR